MKLEWSVRALADLDRFADFLQHLHPHLARHVAEAIIARAEILIAHPKLGRPLAGRDEYRQVVLRVLNADYAFQYRFDGRRLIILRVFHGRETH
jgi:plasmid stabilization system protein ParE